MRIEPNSVKKIMEDNDKVVVYGLATCLYVGVCIYLKQQGYGVYNYTDAPFYEIDVDLASAGDITRRMCKAAITSLIIENYNRSKEGRSIIPLIFCVSVESDGVTSSVDAQKVAQLRGEQSSITDAELRRCVKTYFEMSPEIKAIAEKTFKFVHVKQDSQNKDLYHLEQIEAFWKQPNWEQAWSERLASKKAQPSSKKYLWRELLNKNIVSFDTKKYDVVKEELAPKGSQSIWQNRLDW